MKIGTSIYSHSKGKQKDKGQKWDAKSQRVFLLVISITLKTTEYGIQIQIIQTYLEM